MLTETIVHDTAKALLGEGERKGGATAEREPSFLHIVEFGDSIVPRLFGSGSTLPKYDGEVLSAGGDTVIEVPQGHRGLFAVGCGEVRSRKCDYDPANVGRRKVNHLPGKDEEDFHTPICEEDLDDVNASPTQSVEQRGVATADVWMGQ